MTNNLSKEPPIFFMGKVVGFDEQEDQVKGGGWGWRYKVAIFDTYSSKESDIDDADIEYAIAVASNSDGSGGADRRRSMRISQGDTVIGLKYGGKRGIAFITGIIPRTKNTVFGPGRFDTETGYYVSLQARGLFGSNQEFSECAGHESPGTTPRCANKDKTVPAKKKEEKLKELGLGDTENKIGQLKKPLVPVEESNLQDALDQNDSANSGFATPIATDLPNELPPPPTYDELPVGSKTDDGGTISSGIKQRYPGGPRYQTVTSGLGDGAPQTRWIDNPRDPKFDEARAAAGNPPRSTTPPPGGMLW